MCRQQTPLIMAAATACTGGTLTSTGGICEDSSRRDAAALDKVTVEVFVGHSKDRESQALDEVQAIAETGTARRSCCSNKRSVAIVPLPPAQALSPRLSPFTTVPRQLTFNEY